MRGYHLVWILVPALMAAGACKKEEATKSEPKSVVASPVESAAQPANKAEPTAGNEAAKGDKTVASAAVPAPTTAGEPGAATAAATATIPEKVTVQVLDPGGEPKQALRYKFSAGRKDTFLMDMKMAMTVEMGGTSQPEVKLPVMRMTMEVDSQSVSPEGNLTYAFKLGKVELLDEAAANPMIVNAMKGELAKMEGITGSAVVTPRGVTEKADIQLPPNAGQQLQQMIDSMRQQLNQMSAPLPEEPVGVGARWKVVMPVNTPVLKIVQTATYALKELQGNTGTFQIDLMQDAPAQRMQLPNLPAGSEASLKSLKTTGSGTISFDLTKPVPRTVLDTNSTTAMSVKMGGQAQDLSMIMVMQVKIEPQAQP